ncbi:MAG TPA: hypothetical protein VG123_09660, partial [Streptosporangiaceae bacterium]|nr:hypothetical protein [Streptosporangiaceae bacterium]
LWAACAGVDQREGPIYTPWFVPHWEEQMRQARQALGPGRAREAEERGAAMTLAAAAEYALLKVSEDSQKPHAMPALSQLSPREQELVTLVARQHQGADRCPAVHQRPHRRLAPGPDPGQDRLPPPRRPDPPGPHRTPGLARPRPTPVPVASDPGSCRDPKGVRRPLPRAPPGRPDCY